LHSDESSQAVPLVFGGFTQVPVASLQAPATWQTPGGGQVTGVPGAQAPFWHVSCPLHFVPSSHAVPLGNCAGVEQVPLAGSQVLAPWQASAPGHVTAVPPVQMPAWHVSRPSHFVALSQAVLSGTFAVVQVPSAAQTPT
jgi:hypothetical protein